MKTSLEIEEGDRKQLNCYLNTDSLLSKKLNPFLAQKIAAKNNVYVKVAVIIGAKIIIFIKR